MKRMKKILCLMLALVLAMGMCVTAIAAPDDGENPDDGEKTTVSISVKDDDEHTYEVFQIFTGDYDIESKTLSTIKWGQHGTGTPGERVNPEILKELERVAGDDVSDIAQLNVIQNYWNKSATTGLEVSVSQELTGLPAGYYLIRDTTLLEDETIPTIYIVKMVGSYTITRKAEDTPTLEKEVKEGTKDYDDYVKGPVDYSIGDTISFRLTGTLPEHFSDYETYEYVFKDKLSAGLTLDKNTVNVYLVQEDMSDNAINITNKFTPDYTTDSVGYNMTLTCDDLKDVFTENSLTVNSTNYSNYTIVVTYNAELNDEAEIGGKGNPNDAHLEFTNNPDKGGHGDKGKTPDETVVVFTFRLNGNKYDIEDGTKKLQGAEFILYRVITTLDENASEVSTPEYAIISNNRVTRWTKDENSASKVTSDEDGKFKIEGLGKGTYFLKEITAPTGYNLPENPFELIVTATYNTLDNTIEEITLEIPNEEGENYQATGDQKKGDLQANIPNGKGSILPETGGIGTTIFYVLGGILVIGCGVILITRKRVSKLQ